MNQKNDLSEREQEILKLVATGASNKEIASRLSISPNTVKVHLQNIFEKTGTGSRTAAAASILLQQQKEPGQLPQTPEPSGSVSASLPAAHGTKPFHAQLRLAGLIVLGLLVVSGAAFWLGRSIPASGSPVKPTPAASTGLNRWQTELSMPQARSGMAATVYEGALYLIGGENENGPDSAVFRYFPGAESWEKQAPKITPVSQAGAALLGEKIYVPGGLDPDGKTSRVLEVYDPRRNFWETHAPLPVPLRRYALAVLEGRIILFGGVNDSSYSNAVYTYDPDADTWQFLTSMPQALADAAAAPLENKILLAGGYNGKSACREAYAFYPQRAEEGKQAWEALSPLPEGRYAFGAAALANIFTGMGGLGPSEETMRTAVQYSPQSNRWSVLAVPPDALGAYPSLLPLGDRLHFIGGRVNGSPTSRHLSYQAVYTLLIPMIEN